MVALGADKLTKMNQNIPSLLMNSLRANTILGNLVLQVISRVSQSIVM
jgi:hypothetical protein